MVKGMRSMLPTIERTSGYMYSRDQNIRALPFMIVASI